MEAYAAWVDTRCQEVGALFKPGESYIGAKYTFNGVAFDHENGRVACGQKIIRRLQRARFCGGTYGELEAAVARLLHASAVLGLDIASKYWELKAVRRRVNALNRGTARESDVVTLSHGVVRRLVRWTGIVLENRAVVPRVHVAHAARTHHLFTDASKEGWGAWLMLETGEVLLAGAPWSRGLHYEVNAAETKAVALATEAFRHHFARGTCVNLHIDNTSALAAVNKRHAGSAGVSKALSRVLYGFRTLGITMHAQYITSKENPADAVSRGRTAVWRVGEGGAAGAAFTQSHKQKSDMT
jgi:hypothetical protein